MNNEHHEAKMAGEQDAETDVSRILWIVIGFFINIIGVIIAYVYQPSPPASRLFEKSQEYVLFYTEGYKNKARSIQLMSSLIGLGIVAAGYVLIFVFGMVMIGSIRNIRY